MARQGLPKKYAKMGFKRGWKAYKASKRGRSTKRTYRPKTTKRRSYTRSNPGPARKKGWGIGRYIHAGRIGDIITRPLQQGIGQYGLNKQGLDRAGVSYTLGLSDRDGKYNKAHLGHYYGMGTALATDAIESKAGVFRGAGKGKILSVLQATSSEWLAALKINPADNLNGWNRQRIAFAQGTIENGAFMSSPAIKSMFLTDKGVKLGLGVLQKVVFNVNGMTKLNKFLPKGVNF